MSTTELKTGADLRLVNLALAYITEARKPRSTPERLLKCLGWQEGEPVYKEGLQLEIAQRVKMYVSFDLPGLNLSDREQRVGIVKTIPQECTRIPYVVVHPEDGPRISDTQLLFLSRNPHSKVVRVPNEAALNNLLINFARLIA